MKLEALAFLMPLALYVSPLFYSYDQNLPKNNARPSMVTDEQLGRLRTQTYDVPPDLRALNPPGERRTDRLMAETDTQERHSCGRGGSHERNGDPGLSRGAGTGRNDDPRRSELHYLLGGQHIVSVDDRVSAQLSYVLHQVVREAVVVVENQDHASWAASADSVTTSDSERPWF